MFFSAYTTRRYTDGVWPYNLLPYGLPYVCNFTNFLRQAGIIQFLNQLHFQYHLSLHPFPICPFANITHLLNFQSSTIGGKHLLLLNQFMNLFGMPPLLGGGKDGLKIGSVGLLLIVTEVQVVI